MLQLLNRCDAFQVEELPKYEACGSGSQTWLWLRKENLHTDTCVHILGKLFGCKARGIGYAGKKDKLSLSYQWFSVADVSHAEALKNLPLEGEEHGGSWAIEKIVAHDHSLGMGQLLGNRFRIFLDPDLMDASDEAALITACQKLSSARGEDCLLNLYGSQRFGHNGQNLTAARLWAAGDYQDCVDLLLSTQRGDAGMLRTLVRAAEKETNPKQILNRAGKTVNHFFASVAQSHIFNVMATARRDAGLLFQVREGDLLLRQGKSAFHVRPDEIEQLQSDVAAGLAATSAALPGAKVRRPGPSVEAEEQRWIADCGIDSAVFRRGGVFQSPGERRRIVLQFLEALNYDLEAHCLHFALPAGSYATLVMDALGIADPRR